MAHDWSDLGPGRTLPDWTLELGASTPWEELAFSRPDYLSLSTSSLRLPEETARQGESIIDSGYSAAMAALHPPRGMSSPEFDTIDHASEHISDQLADVRHGVLNRLRDWWNLREVLVVETQPAVLRFPLFLLSAPEVEGCSTALQRSSEHVVEGAFDLTIFGTGLTYSRSASVKATTAITVPHGDSELVFVDVPITVEHVEVKEHGAHVASGFRHQLAAKALEHLSMQVARVPAERMPKFAEAIRTFPLEETDPGVVREDTFAYACTHEMELKLGFKAFGADQSATGTVSTLEGSELKVTLQGGHHYEAFHCTDMPGILWRTG